MTLAMSPMSGNPSGYNLQARWRRFIQETRGAGAWHVFRHLLNPYIPRKLFKFGSFHIIALELQALEVSSEGVSGIRPATMDDIDALVALGTTRDEIDLGTEVWVVEQAGELIAYDICGADTKIISDFIRLKACERDTWAIGIWVAPQARGQGLAAQLRCRVAEEFRKRSVVHLLGTISATNKRSIRTFTKIGAKFVERIDYAWLYGFGAVWFGGKFRVGYWTTRRPLTLAISLNSPRKPQITASI
jgi:GNAT superfamily N-acetyltransferase